ncbi:MAG: hypothetical protein H7A20_06510 [Rhodanobacteraceae bacterium]|nr:hypothetical protein [Xanthomonadales bacterium]MCP5478421.1 hypothetical protein [Rhodanobacteraceae bacterium]HPF72565.1 DUF6164 family protein [Xanthomonadaceae bacterium]HRX99931.1 DUF6164 family protein [Xanthomonadaceae bacterium]
MSTLLLNLRHVPDDEADDVRALLDEQGIAWYETEQGRWGISFAGIWLRDDSELMRARELLDTYQRERRERVKAEYRQAKADGSLPSVLSELRRNPGQLLLAAFGILLMLGLVALPAFLLSR